MALSLAGLIIVTISGAISESYFIITYADLPLVCRGVDRTDRNDCALEINTDRNIVKDIEIISAEGAGICDKESDHNICSAFRSLLGEFKQDLIGKDPFLISNSPLAGVELVDSFVDKALRLFPSGSTMAAFLEDYRSEVKAIINNDILIVKKHVVNDDGGNKKAGDFTIRISGNNPSVSEFAGSESGTSVIVSAGLYGVSELADSSYESSFSSDCNGNMEARKTKTCIVTNNDIARQPSTTGR